MRKIVLIIVLISSFIMVSCRVKNSCELNHTGTIAVINNYGETIELRINNENIGNIENGNVRTAERPIGSYKIKVIKYPLDRDTTVNVTECDVVEYRVRK